MAIICPEKVNEEKIIGQVHNKVLITQDFKDPRTGEIIPWGMLKGLKLSSIILPLTIDYKVIAIRQFRYGANQVVLELPGGNIEGDQTSQDAAQSELLQETGYVAEKIIPLSSSGIIAEPSCLQGAAYFGFLGLNCVWKQKPKLDDSEDIEVVTMDLDEWIWMMYNIPNKVNGMLALTFLALPHLGLFSPGEPKPTWQNVS